MAPAVPVEVVVHPLVLLSVVDHYNRMSKGVRLRNKRVVGVLLGETFKGRVDVSNSFAVPFEEDAKDPSIWYLHVSAGRCLPSSASGRRRCALSGA